MTDINIILISVAFILALAAIYVLYAIMMYQGGRGTKGEELQLSTKNILDQVQVLFDKGEYALVELLATKYLDRVPKCSENIKKYISKLSEYSFYLALFIELTIVILEKSEYIIQYEGLWFRLTFVLFGLSLITTKIRHLFLNFQLMRRMFIVKNFLKIML